MKDDSANERVIALRSYFRHYCYRDDAAKAFVDDVRESLQWDYTRFTNILFARHRISSDNPDGIPPSARRLQRRVDYVFVDVPPGLLLRAAKGARVDVDVMALKLCAVFETYGIELERLQRRRRSSERQAQKEIGAWTDVGLSLRTETDMGGKDIYCEDMTDFLQ